MFAPALELCSPGSFFSLLFGFEPVGDSMISTGALGPSASPHSHSTICNLSPLLTTCHLLGNVSILAFFAARLSFFFSLVFLCLHVLKYLHFLWYFSVNPLHTPHLCAHVIFELFSPSPTHVSKFATSETLKTFVIHEHPLKLETNHTICSVVSHPMKLTLTLSARNN